MSSKSCPALCVHLIGKGLAGKGLWGDIKALGLQLCRHILMADYPACFHIVYALLYPGAQPSFTLQVLDNGLLNNPGAGPVQLFGHYI